MKVTDEMVAAAMAAFETYFQDPAHERQCDECNGEGCTPVGVDSDRDWCPKCGGPGTLNDATEEGGIRAALESFALSHAAGQEVVEALIEEVQAFADAYPTDVFGPVTDDEREQYGSLITRASASMGRHMGRRFLPKALALRAALCPAPGVDGLRQGNWHHPDGGRIVGWVIEPDDVERMGADSFCLPREVAEALANLRDRNTAVASNTVPPTTSAEVGQDGEQCRAASVLTADMAKALPNGTMDDSTFQAVEDALDAIEAPITGPDGRWLTLPQRIRALSRGVPEGK